MFEFFKELNWQMQGLDVKKIKEERFVKEQKKRSVLRIFIITLGILLFIIMIFNIIVSTGKMSFGLIIKNILLVTLTAISIIFTIINKKKSEIISMLCLLTALMFSQLNL